LTGKLFTKLLALFVLLLVFYTIVMDLVFSRLVSANLLREAAGAALHPLSREALLSGLIALAVALPLAAWAAGVLSARLDRVVAFARRIADGELSARLPHQGNDEVSNMEDALNLTAERLGQSFAEIESRRQELAAMLDSMQEAVVAITPEGLVRWSNAVMERIAGTQIRTGRPLVHSVRDPELLACVRTALEQREVRTSAPLPCPRAAPSPCSTTSRASRPRSGPAATSLPTSATSCAHRSLPFRVTSKPSLKNPIPARRPPASFSASSSRTPPA
jgi:two-component system phosphate regulon sensor histidine kinase PhoR